MRAVTVHLFFLFQRFSRLSQLLNAKSATPKLLMSAVQSAAISTVINASSRSAPPSPHHKEQNIFIFWLLWYFNVLINYPFWDSGFHSVQCIPDHLSCYTIFAHHKCVSSFVSSIPMRQVFSTVCQEQNHKMHVLSQLGQLSVLYSDDRKLLVNCKTCDLKSGFPRLIFFILSVL